MLLTVQFNFSSRILPKEYLVSQFNVYGDQLAVLLFPWPHRDYFALLGFLFGGVRDD